MAEPVQHDSQAELFHKPASASTQASTAEAAKVATEAAAFPLTTFHNDNPFDIKPTAPLVHTKRSGIHSTVVPRSPVVDKSPPE
eukprot:m.3981 g.3981  ORF g.3981 m.3981 type:complete len:84 (-) comp4374_c0_seq1:831-1082(-)